MKGVHRHNHGHKYRQKRVLQGPASQEWWAERNKKVVDRYNKKVEQERKAKESAELKKAKRPPTPKPTPKPRPNPKPTPKLYPMDPPKKVPKKK